MTFIERAWRKQSWWLYLLAPLSCLFWGLSALRRCAFATGIQRVTRLSVPVIVVGNISVGGNGKTPVVLALVKHLIDQGYRPGILSRGYGAQCQDFPYLVNLDDTATWAGDEPLLMAQQSHVPVVIDPVRVRGGQLLATQCDVIICDDGLQHYALHRDLEIVVMDGRRNGNGWVLPVGHLRELPSRLKSVDYIIVNSANTVSPSEISMTLQAQPIQPVNANEQHGHDSLPVPHRFDWLMTGIGNPHRFMDTCATEKIEYTNTRIFPDHHPFNLSDMPQGSIIMTQKDAVKCADFVIADATVTPNWFYVPIQAQFSDDFLLRLTQQLATITTRSEYGI